MITSEVEYLGNLRTKCTHLSSGTEILTDAPTDNQGKGEAFSPTDLLATALSSCMFTIMGIAARTHQINIEGATCSTTKIMATEPRRVMEVIIEFNFPPLNLSSKEKQLLENAAKHCPVAKSLHTDLKQTIIFNF